MIQGHADTCNLFSFVIVNPKQSPRGVEFLVIPKVCKNLTWCLFLVNLASPIVLSSIISIAICSLLPVLETRPLIFIISFIAVQFKRSQDWFWIDIAWICEPRHRNRNRQLKIIIVIMLDVTIMIQMIMMVVNSWSGLSDVIDIDVGDDSGIYI